MVCIWVADLTIRRRKLVCVSFFDPWHRRQHGDSRLTSSRRYLGLLNPYTYGLRTDEHLANKAGHIEINGDIWDWSVKMPISATTAYGVQASVQRLINENAHRASLSSRFRGRLKISYRNRYKLWALIQTIILTQSGICSSHIYIGYIELCIRLVLRSNINFSINLNSWRLFYVTFVASFVSIHAYMYYA